MVNPVTLELSATIHPKPIDSPAAIEAAALFGLDTEQHQPLTLFPPISLTLNPSHLIFITGPSGSGKSTLLRDLTHKLHQQHPSASLILLDALPPWPDRPLADGLPDPLPSDLTTTTRFLSLAGLAEAALLLRRPSELSQGQHFRLHLAHAMAAAERAPSSQPTLLIADEFAALLDRITAAHIATTLRRWSRTTHATVVVATTHDDLLEPLNPDTLIELTANHHAEAHTR